MIRYIFFCLITVYLALPCATSEILAQESNRFKDEIEVIQKRDVERQVDLPLIVFTGSSSIRMWKDLESTFPGYQVLNHGFGGSEFTDLIHYKETLIFDYSPDFLFIYEGDNDIYSGKSPSEVLAAAAFLFSELKYRLPETSIYFISPKPSISRWNLKEEYEKINMLLSDFCDFDDQLTFIDVWNPMLDENGIVRADLFIEDDLHMNDAGYTIWKEVISEYLKQN